VINPHAVAQYALAIHNEYLSSQAEHLLDEFLKLCDWFVANQKKDEPFKGCWAHNYQLPKYHLPNPWFCGMTQGQVVSTLVRAYQLSKKNAYLECAIDACQPLFKSVDDGGLKREFDGGAIFFEEMPTDFFPHILNHHIYTLFGLFDLLQVSGNDRIEELFDESVCSIEKVLTKFDTGSWSKYKLGGKPTLKNHFNWASPFYHNHHIAQLKVLYSMTGRELFKQYATRWERYREGLFGIFMELIYLFFRLGVLTSKLMRKKLKRGFDIERRVVGVHFHAPWIPQKRWPDDKIASLCEKLIYGMGVSVVVFGDSREESFIQKLTSRFPLSYLVDVSRENLGVYEMATFMKNCCVVVSNDSGPAHLAAACDVPVVVLFGSTDPLRCRPYNDKVEIVRVDLECSPCYWRSKRCTDFKCMRQIDVEDVLEKAGKFLKG